MLRLPAIRTALVTLALFAGVACVSARTSETAVSHRSRTAMQLQALASANYADGILMLLDRRDGDDERNRGWDRDDHSDKDGDKDRDRDRDDKQSNPHAPSPTPEPSTLLSFGAAALIGGAVIYSRRLLRNRK
jgi:hypothetical protein